MLGRMKSLIPQSATALVACFIATLGSWSLCLWGPNLPLLYHKYQHIGCFACWTLTLAWSIRLWLQFSHKATVIISALLGVIASAIGELAQFGMSNHTPEWRGFGWSVAGVAVAVVVILVASRSYQAAQASPQV